VARTLASAASLALVLRQDSLAILPVAMRSRTSALTLFTLCSYREPMMGLRNVPISQAGEPRPDAYDRTAHLYYELLIGALILATGGLTMLLVLVHRPTFRHRAWIYLGFMLIVLPATLYNFSQADTVLAPTYQFMLNWITIFLIATVAIWIGTLPVEAIDLRVVKTMCVFFLWLVCVVLILFNFVWFVNWSQLISLEEARKVTWGTLTGFAGVASAIIAALNYRREMRKAASPPASQSSIIVP
jgi:hypothetical protein